MYKSRRQRIIEEQREYRKRRTLDILYFLFCGVVFYGFVHSITPPVKSFYSFTVSVFNQPEKVEAQTKTIISPVPGEMRREIITKTASWEDFKVSARRIAKIYNYPAQVIISQAALESARGTSHYAVTRNNFFGMGCYDWDPDANCFWYENADQSIIDYIITIRANFPEAWDSRTKPEELVKLLKWNSQGIMYATDPDYVNKVVNMPEWSEEE